VTVFLASRVVPVIIIRASSRYEREISGIFGVVVGLVVGGGVVDTGFGVEEVGFGEIVEGFVVEPGV
jgi:hypothetical protein